MRYVLDTGSVVDLAKRAASQFEGAYTGNAVSADANYENRAAFKITRNGNSYVIENVVTHRYLLGDGSELDTSKTGAENGWDAAPKIYAVDANYYSRIFWTLLPKVGGYAPASCLLSGFLDSCLLACGFI